jgi:carbamoylphosphate synthase large subunit
MSLKEQMIQESLDGIEKIVERLGYAASQNTNTEVDKCAIDLMAIKDTLSVALLPAPTMTQQEIDMAVSNEPVT